MQTPELVQLFEQDSDTVSFEPGETVFGKGDPGDVMYVVLEGRVDLMLHGSHFDTADTGQIFGELALIDAPRRSADAVAASHCRLATVDKRRFSFMVQEHPFFALYVMRVLASRIRKLDRLAPA